MTSNRLAKNVIAHSLGNMVVSAAIQDHGFRPTRYFMLNAAVPAEAYDASLGMAYSASNPLVHPEWHDYASRTWCARWHELFTDGDDRGKLTWRGRFADVADRTELFNFHAGTETTPGDEVLEIRATPPSMLSDLHYEFPFTLEKGHYAWHKQEMGKGRLTSVANPLIAGTTCAGWGFHETNDWVVVGEQVVTLSFPIPAAEANAMTTNELRQAPVFRRVPSEMLQSTISDSDIANALACGIPALSGPAGSRPVTGLNNVDMNHREAESLWGRDSPFYETRWLHSDIKNVAFPYTFSVFQKIKRDIIGHE